MLIEWSNPPRLIGLDQFSFLITYDQTTRGGYNTAQLWHERDQSLIKPGS